MVMFTGLARVAREAGLVVRETSGWKTRTAHRGGMRAARGVLWHHTATAASAVRSRNNPTLNYMINGLGYPLCNYALAWDGSIDVVAAGTAAHAGKGVYTNIPRDQGNYYLIGIEVEGTTGLTWSNAQLEAAAKLGAQLDKEFGGLMHVGHYEYAPRRKVDPTGIPGNMPALRAAIKRGYWSTKTNPSATTTTPSNPQKKASWLEMVSKAELKSLLREEGWGYKGNNESRDAYSFLRSTLSNVEDIKDEMTVTLNDAQKKALATGIETWSLADLTARLTHRIGYTFQRTAGLQGELAGIKELVSQLAEGEGVTIDYDRVEAAAKQGAKEALEEGIDIEAEVTFHNSGDDA